jgi:hypothetical protein
MLAALLSTAALVAACSGSPAIGPLDGLGPAPWQCVTRPAGQPVTLGYYDLRNNGTSAVTILSVRLPPGTRRLIMTKAWLVPIDHDPIGSGWPWPPATQPAWRQRRPAVGAVIRPGQILDLVFGLTRTSGRSGQSGGVVVTYSSGAARYVLGGSVALMVSQDCYTEPRPWNGT